MRKKKTFKKKIMLEGRVGVVEKEKLVLPD